MEIVKKEIIKKVSEYKYYGFLCYLLKHSEDMRYLLLDNLLVFYDIDYTTMENEKVLKKGDCVNYDLNVFEKDGNVEEYSLDVYTDIDDLVVCLSLLSKNVKTIGCIDVIMQFNLYILCDSKEDIFNEFIIRDSDVRKVIGVSPTDLSVSSDTYMDFHFTVSLDHIDDVEIKGDFIEFMYLLKYNKPYDENGIVYKFVELIHNKYLNSEEYALDLEYELEEAKKRALNRN